MRLRRRLETALKNGLRGSPLYGAVKGLRRRMLRAAGHFDVALVDVTDGCNLRCPFCYNDWSGPPGRTLMSEEHFRRVVEILPLFPVGGVALSCSYEPLLHPGFTGLLRTIPRRHRDRGYFSTNLALRLSGEVLEDLAGAPLHHINVSVESLTPGVYEATRRGGSLDRFLDNLRRLSRALHRHPDGPQLHIITMVCDLNHLEIPELVRRCREEFGAAYHELRPFTRTASNREWIDGHALGQERWKALGEALDASGFSHVSLLPLPSEADTVHYMELPETAFVRIEADGTLRLGRNPGMEAELTTHLDEVGALRPFLERWLRRRREVAARPAGRGET